MKTSKLALHPIAVLLTMLVVSTGCQKDEFYEKKYLESPVTSSPDDGGETTGGTTDSGTDGAAQGGADGGSSDGGSTAGSIGGADGGADGGSVAGSDGGVDGGADGGADGGSVAGSDGGVDGGVDGNSDGGADGGADGGSVGGTTGGTWEEETFLQQEESQKKLDILWVVDNSGSMGDEQASLGQNFNLFIQDFMTRQTDFKMAITTTDGRDGRRGVAVPNSIELLTSTQAQNDPDEFIDNFRDLIYVGTNGSGTEQGLLGSAAFMDNYAASWLRSDAYLVVVYVSDEEDQSPASAQDYVTRLQQEKQNAGLVKAYSIVGMQCDGGQGVSCGYQRYADVTQATGALVADIKDSFAQTLQDMAQNIVQLLDSFPLAHDPIIGSITVTVNDVNIPTDGWTVENRAIKFLPGHVPSAGASIKVRYAH